MKTIRLLKMLERMPLFTENDISKITNKSQEYVRTLLYRLHKKGLIRRIEKGKYTVHEDEIIFASYIAKPSYLSLWTAFRHYNMTQQQPFSLFVMVPVARKAIKISNTEILFSKTVHMFGYKKEKYSDFNIFMAEREKAIIDAMLFRLPLQDILEAINEETDYEKLASYAKRVANISLIKRLGYILKMRTGKSYGLKAMDNNYIPLDYLGKKKGKKDSYWKLIINHDNKERT
ncbi:hypothetical protein J4401_05095 [Candidatus Woesearchaeota archaeon]|nr:hypothetical protein [Candidatus Woesearchaeota archaeon]